MVANFNFTKQITKLNHNLLFIICLYLYLYLFIKVTNKTGTKIRENVVPEPKLNHFRLRNTAV